MELLEVLIVTESSGPLSTIFRIDFSLTFGTKALPVSKRGDILLRVSPRHSVVSEVRLNRLAVLQSATLDNTTADWALKVVLICLDCEVCEGDFVRTSVDKRGNPVIASIHSFVANRELVVPTIICITDISRML
jgi:hypothetical protein